MRKSTLLVSIVIHLNTKKFFNDHKQIMAFHGYQSFEPGEVSGEVAHEIGVKLVEELYGI